MGRYAAGDAQSVRPVCEASTAYIWQIFTYLLILATKACRRTLRKLLGALLAVHACGGHRMRLACTESSMYSVPLHPRTT